MGLFDFFNSFFGEKKPIKIYAPIDGGILPIEQTSDEAFSQKIVGDGVAIDPSGTLLVAPASGEVGKIFRTNHAFSLLTVNGVELFVHFGMNTLELEGKGFERLAKEGQKVKVGDPIIKVDLEYLRANARSVLTPVVVSNTDDFQITEYQKGVVKAGQSLVFELLPKKKD